MTIYLFFVGAILASFLGLVICRFPDASIIRPASHCDHCKRRLSWYELVPIISQIALRFKCRTCHKPIPKWFCVFELASALCLASVTTGRLTLPLYLLFLMSVVLACYDIKEHAFPLVLWVIFTGGILLLTGISPLFCGLLVLSAIVSRYSNSLGSGDILYLATTSLVIPFSKLPFSLFLASSLGILAFLIQKDKKELPFVPFLSIGVAIVCLL